MTGHLNAQALAAAARIAAEAPPLTGAQADLVARVLRARSVPQPTEERAA